MNTTKIETLFQTVCPLGYVIATYFKRGHAEKWLAIHRVEQTERGVRLGELDYSTVTIKEKAVR